MNIQFNIEMVMFKECILERIRTIKEKLSVFLTEVYKDRWTLIFYIVGIVILFFSEVYKEQKIFLYLGLIIFSFGSIIWLFKLYEKFKDNSFAKIMFFIITSFSVCFSSISSDLAISYHTGLPAEDFHNTFLFLTTLSYIPMFCFISAFMVLIVLLALIILYPIFYHVKINCGFILSVFGFKNKIRKNNLYKEILFLFNSIGILFIYALSISYLKVFLEEKPIILNVMSYLDYKHFFNHPDVPGDKRVLIHNNNFYSIIELGDDGNKFIKVIEISKK